MEMRKSHCTSRPIYESVPKATHIVATFSGIQLQAVFDHQRTTNQIMAVTTLVLASCCFELKGTAETRGQETKATFLEVVFRCEDLAELRRRYEGPGIYQMSFILLYCPVLGMRQGGVKVFPTSENVKVIVLRPPQEEQAPGNVCALGTHKMVCVSGDDLQAAVLMRNEAHDGSIYIYSHLMTHCCGGQEEGEENEEYNTCFTQQDLDEIQSGTEVFCSQKFVALICPQAAVLHSPECML